MLEIIPPKKSFQTCYTQRSIFNVYALLPKCSNNGPFRQIFADFGKCILFDSMCCLRSMVPNFFYLSFGRKGTKIFLRRHTSMVFYWTFVVIVTDLKYLYRHDCKICGFIGRDGLLWDNKNCNFELA